MTTLRAFVERAVLVVVVIGSLPAVPCVQAQTTRANPSLQGLGNAFSSDVKYFANNVEADGEDIVTAPLHINAAGALLTDPWFYLVAGAAGAAFGGSFALDQTMRSHLHDMSSNTASTLQDISYGSVGAAVGLLYGYGLFGGDTRARQYALTAGEGAGIATLLNVGIKDAFGRLRPSQDHHDHDAFFHGGQSFTSGDVTPMFALACGVSEYYDNRWYIAIPAYSLALLDGFGSMGHDAHWFSDVVGAALLGVGTTELFLYLHQQHEEHPWRLRIFPVSPPMPARHATQNSAPTGLMLAFSW